MGSSIVLLVPIEDATQQTLQHRRPCSCAVNRPIAPAVLYLQSSTSQTISHKDIYNNLFGEKFLLCDGVGQTSGVWRG
jgi:hypothetical protein